MSDLIQRLIDLALYKHSDVSVAEEAVDRIDAQAVRIGELEAALREIEYLDRPQVRGLPRRRTIQEIAKEALEGGKDE